MRFYYKWLVKFKFLKELLFKLPYVPFSDVFRNVIIREKRRIKWTKKKYKKLGLEYDET